MASTALDFRWELRPNFAYCAKCGWEDRSATNPLGTLVWCPHDDRKGFERHHARIVAGDVGKRWLRNEWWLLQYAAKWSPRRWRWWARYLHDRVGLYVGFQWTAVCVAVAIVATADSLRAWSGQAYVSFTSTTLALGLAAAVAVDVLLVNTALAFAMRRPTHGFRSAVFGLSAFALIAIAYSVAYQALAPAFVNINHWWDAVYFSFVTIATVGYGDIQLSFASTQTATRVVAQALIVAEILTGLYFLAIILTTLVQWANTVPPWQDIRHAVERQSGQDSPDRPEARAVP